MKNKQDIAMMVVLYISSFAAGFNNNLVNVALNSIMADLCVDATTAQWLVSGFMIVTLVVVSSMAFLYRRFNMRNLFVVAQSSAIVGGLLGLFAPNFPILLVARLIQAIYTGIGMSLTMNTILILAKPERKAFMIALVAAIISFAPALAPVICGVFVTAFGWHTIFVIPVLLAVCLLIAGLVVIRNANNPVRPHFDMLSAVLLGVGLVPLAYGLTQIVASPAKAAGFIVAGAVVIALFAWRQSKLEEPLLNLKPLKRLAFWPSCVLVLISLMTNYSVSVLMPMYMQSALGFTALRSGLCMLVPVLFSAAFSVMAGNVMDRKGPWPLLPLGFFVILAGQAINCAFSGQMVLLPVLAGACFAYAGVGLTSATSQTTGLTALSEDEGPFGTSLQGACVQLSGCFGPTLYVGIMNSVMDKQVAVGVTANAAAAAGISHAFAVAIGISFACFVIALLYARYRRNR